jgi:hypothetical protein
MCNNCRSGCHGRSLGWGLVAALAGLVAGPAPVGAGPLSLHPKNPHYFLFRDRPAVLITSGEHYGAVLNLDFDYVPYLNELQAHGLNLTRTFAGTYREVPGTFNIVENTLAPKPGRFACPWARSSTPGAGDGGNKFDLHAYDPAYFARLKDFVAQAGKRGVVVELVLFCSVYNDQLWAVNPMNAANNVQGVGHVPRLEAFTLKDKGLQAAQDALVRKIVAELKEFDNVYYEVCNEPYAGNVSSEWNDHVVTVIVEAEKDLPARHLIAQNIANDWARVRNPNPHVSVFNFHYATPPRAVAENYRLNKVIGDDETGFRGREDRPYRTEGWEFILAGGAVYSNLDYSFTPGKPDGTFPVTTSPGGGGPELRRQLSILKRFIEGFDFIAMRPANRVLKGGRSLGPLPLEGRADDAKEARVSARVLAEPGKAYAVYVRGGTQAELVLDLPAGPYSAEWVSTRTGQVEKAETFEHDGGDKGLTSPAYAEDIALRVIRR